MIPGSVRLAHVTDVHLLALDGTRLADFVNKRFAGAVDILLSRGLHHTAEVFDSLVDDINAQGIEQVACTGDITNLSLESEFRFARSRFDRLGPGPANVTCVPGNHDTYITQVEGLFERVFAPYVTADDGWGWDDGDPWPTVRVRGDLALVGLSTSRPSGLLMGHGSVGAKQLGRLEQVLGDPRLADRLRVIVMHHPSAGRHARGWRRGLRDHAAVARVFEGHGAELVLHGHEHVDLENHLAGPGGARVPVNGVRSGSYALVSRNKTAHYRVYSVRREGGGRPRVWKSESFTWSPPTRRFVREPVL
jgi:3',5'-cyclic AMP phosphodiesterase CpdA